MKRGCVQGYIVLGSYTLRLLLVYLISPTIILFKTSFSSSIVHELVYSSQCLYQHLVLVNTVILTPIKLKALVVMLYSNIQVA